MLEKFRLIGNGNKIYGTFTDEATACHWAELLHCDVEVIQEELQLFDNQLLINN